MREGEFEGRVGGGLDKESGVPRWPMKPEMYLVSKWRCGASSGQTSPRNAPQPAPPGRASALSLSSTTPLGLTIHNREVYVREKHRP